jgi:sugar phosphate isomerase/epimerase
MVVISCSTRSLPEMPLDRALARISWAGFRSTELFLPPAGPPPEAAALAAHLEAADLSLAAIDAGLLGGEDGAAGLKSAAHLGRCAVLARNLQANRVICDLAIVSEPLARQLLNQLLAALAPVPALLCLRNRPEDAPPDRERLLRLIGMDADRLGLALDPGAACRAGWDPIQTWECLQPSVRHLYVTDAAGSAAAVPGTGDVRWEELAERVRESGYSGAVSLRAGEATTFADPLFAEAELKETRFLMESWFDGAQ